MLEFILELFGEIIILGFRDYLKNHKRNKLIRIFWVLLIFPLPIWLVLLLGNIIREINNWWVTGIAIVVVAYYTYLTFKYLKGILWGFKK